jgi:D-lactate dehydrogenase (cytochrome)
VLGHIGDGNFHAILLPDPRSKAEMMQARQANDRIVARAIASGGTCTGEHGIGLGKREALRQELGEAVELMESIKRAIDPKSLMNPGKIILPNRSAPSSISGDGPVQ